MHIKEGVLAFIGAVGGILASLLGGWDAVLRTLLLFMGVDYLLGLLVAGVFKRSDKTDDGGLESRAGWKGLCRKGVSLTVVLVAAQLDGLLGVDTNYIRNGVVIAFTANEALSIVENAGLIGVPIPEIVKDAISVLKKEAEERKVKKV